MYRKYSYDIKYLKEPDRKIWENPESYVDTLARKGFRADYPQAYKFFQQYKIEVETGDEWIYQIGRENKKPDVVAKNWIKENMDTVETWLEGVKSVNGEDAVTTLKNNLGV